VRPAALRSRCVALCRRGGRGRSRSA
jgi:hypothetical protein